MPEGTFREKFLLLALGDFAIEYRRFREPTLLAQAAGHEELQPGFLLARQLSFVDQAQLAQSGIAYQRINFKDPISSAARAASTSTGKSK